MAYRIEKVITTANGTYTIFSPENTPQNTPTDSEAAAFIDAGVDDELVTSIIGVPTVW